MFWPIVVQRPLSSHISLGWIVGSRNSWPIRSISSRTMPMILLTERFAEEEVGINAGAELTDITGAEQELVAGDLGVGGGFAKGGDKKFRPTMHDFGDLLSCLGPPSCRGLVLSGIKALILDVAERFPVRRTNPANRPQRIHTSFIMRCMILL